MSSHSSQPWISPAKKRHLAFTNLLPRAPRSKAPSARIKVEPKPLNLDADTIFEGSNTTTLLYSMSSGGEGDSTAPDIPTVPVTVPNEALLGADTLSHTEVNYQSLAERARAINIRRNEQLVENKGTKRQYGPRVAAYEAWWQADQDRLQEEARVGGINIGPPIPAHPITVEKVSIYMEYECSREKHRASVAGQTVGISSIKATISALEKHRSLHADDPEYKRDPASQVPLRSSHHINAIERLGQAKEPERLAESQELKKYGVHSQTFTQAELQTITVSYFNPNKSSPNEFVLNMRDRAMLLFSTNFAFRGDDTRAILMSDLLIDDFPMLDIGPDASLKSLLVFSNNGKTNANGRIDILATFRHRDPLYCAFGALGFYLFSLFHIQKRGKPNFHPDFDHPDHGASGFRDWYNLILFPARNSPYKEMSADNHRKRFNQVKFDLDLYFKKVTHAGRPHAATTAIAAGASVESVKAVGLWSTPGSFSCYNRAFPIDAMVGIAGFNSRAPESYFVPRSELSPPEELLSSIFPWVEEEEAALQDRTGRLGRDASDASLVMLLRLLRHLRTVVLQDAAVLFTEHGPSFAIFKYAPFNTPAFRDFASASGDIISAAILSAQTRSQHLPQKVSAVIKGVLQTSVIHQEETKNSIASLQAEQNTTQQLVFTVCKVLAGPSGKKRRQIDDLEEIFRARSNVIRPKMHHSPSESLLESTSLSPPSLCTDDHDSVVASEPTATPSALTPAPISKESPLTLSVSASEVVVSGAGNVYSPQTFPMSSVPQTRAQQMAALTKIENAAAPDALKRHLFFWDTAPRAIENWVPVFENFWKPSNGRMPSYTQIWNEYKHGIGGQLSIEQLDNIWGPRWRRADSVKQEYRRRKKVVELIAALSAQDGWDEDRAVQHIEDQYSLSSSSTVSWQKNLRSFVEHLQKCKGDFSFFLNASQNMSNVV